MQNNSTELATQNQVLAVFEPNAISFDVPLTTTLEDLAGRLAEMGDWHYGALNSVTVRLNSRLPPSRRSR
jgi:hypothetical protein